MSAAADTHGYDDHHVALGGAMRWIAATNNYKDIGTLRLVFSLTMFCIGFADIAGKILFSHPGSPLWS